MKQVTQSGSYIFLLISNCSQAQVLKVTYIFKIFRVQTCLVFVAYIFRTDSVIESCSIKYPYSPATPNPPYQTPSLAIQKKNIKLLQRENKPQEKSQLFQHFFNIFSTFFNIFLTFSTNFNNKLGKITPDQGGKVTEIKVVNHKIKNQFEIIVQSLKIKRPVRNNIDGDSVIHGTEIYAQHRRILRIDDSINSSDYFSY